MELVLLLGGVATIAGVLLSLYLTTRRQPIRYIVSHGPYFISEPEEVEEHGFRTEAEMISYIATVPANHFVAVHRTGVDLGGRT